MDSLRTYFMLVSFTLGQASYQTRGPFAELEPSKKVRAESIAGREYRVTQRLEVPLTWDFDAAFEFCLALVLTGIEGAISGGAIGSKRND